ncbi:trypsin-like serine peptidase [Streptomyces chattanoogensis]|uniref:trypsin-like serine peptidase n=1 Tax=Streptomyces chattanoogensis TaxID=66876 RepID=UPI0036CDA3B0
MRQQWGRTAAVVLGATIGLATATVGGVAVAQAGGVTAAPARSADDGGYDGSQDEGQDESRNESQDGGSDEAQDGGSDTAQGGGARTSWTGEDAAAYWTPQRMAAAIAPAHGRTVSRTSPAPLTGRSGAKKTSGRVPAGRHFDGIPSVGVLFSVDGDSKAHHCTASVVHSPSGNLILTAGHCNPGSRAAFVPQYTSGATTQPYGIWAIDAKYDYPGRGTTGPGADLDFAFATVVPDDQGRSLESVTGGNTLTPTPGYRNKVTVVGYPSVRNDPQDRAVRCDTSTSRLSGTRQLRMECGGFYGGTSGSPWLTHYDERTRTGRIVGLIGGLNGGGPTGPNSDRTSYSPYFGTEIMALYARATQEG